MFSCESRNPIRIMTVFAGLIAALLVSGCNTTQRMVVPKVEQAQSVTVSVPVDQQASFALGRVVAGIRRGTVIGHYPAYKGNAVVGEICNASGGSRAEITWSSGSTVLGNWSTELGETFFAALRDHGVNVVGDPADMFGQATAAQSSEYQIGARINRIASNLCTEYNFWTGQEYDRYNGELYIDVEWSVRSTLSDTTVLTLQTQGYATQTRYTREAFLIMLNEAFASAAEGLLANADFVALAERRPTSQQASVPAAEPEAWLDLDLPNESVTDARSRINTLLAAVATVRIGAGHGSGFFIASDGYLVTNAHVVGNAKQVTIVLNNNLEVSGDVLRVSTARDVALVKVGVRVPDALPVRRQAASRLEEVYVIGSPILEGMQSTVSTGIVSALRRVDDKDFIQSDAAASPGNSGGPMIDVNGNVIGITVAGIKTPGAENLNLFIPIDDALQTLRIRQTPRSS